MINQGTIFEESLIIVKFLLVGIFFAFIYYMFQILNRILNRDSYTLKFKQKYSNKIYKKCKNPLATKESKRNKIRNKVIEFILDIIYFVIITPMMAIFLFGFNNGKVRWYIYVAVLVGFLIYRLILGRISVFIVEYSTFYFLLLNSHIFKIILKPLRVLRRFKPRKKPKKNVAVNNRAILYSYGKSRR